MDEAHDELFIASHAAYTIVPVMHRHVAVDYRRDAFQDCKRCATQLQEHLLQMRRAVGTVPEAGVSC